MAGKIGNGSFWWIVRTFEVLIPYMAGKIGNNVAKYEPWEIVCLNPLYGRENW
jgi:hypothetical protein